MKIFGNLSADCPQPAKRPWVTVSGVMVEAIVVVYFAIITLPITSIVISADSMGDWFLLWTPVLGCVLLSLLVGILIIHGKRRDRLLWRVVKYVIISFGGAGLIVAGLGILVESLKPPMNCTQAVIDMVITPEDEWGKGEKTITDAKEVQKLVSFFPHLGHGRKSGRAGTWQESSSITFTGCDGRVVRVMISWPCDCWSEGDGDWPLNPEFTKYVTALLETSASSTPSTSLGPSTKPAK